MNQYERTGFKEWTGPPDGKKIAAGVDNTPGGALSEKSYPNSITDEQISQESGKEVIQPDSEKKYFTLATLLQAVLPDLVYYIARILTTGLTLLWAPPKGGKSILVLGFLLAISSGGRALGKLQTRKAACLLISLEDGPRRLQTRFISANAIPNNDLHIFTDWSRGIAGLKDIEKFLDQHQEIKVVCIDTLVLFSKTKDTNDYSETTNFMSMLKRIADDRDLCIIAIHHSKKVGKEPSGDMTETALGSTGIVAGPDHLMYLKRTPNGQEDAILYYRSKDAEPAELALHFEHDIAGWIYAGEASELAETEERQEIIDLLKKEGPMKTGAIAEKLGKTTQAISNLIRKMVKNETIHKLAYGLYSLPSLEPRESDLSDVSSLDDGHTIPGTYTLTPLTPGNNHDGNDQPVAEELDIF